ncbi:hypothetical protein SPBR_05422 [Sporothrix brasiliensis 5110]|uniref:Uncharacterized protein n=1 Tax=Sporothrix brasiliensis 5110 TaxID=1398154 RepID=A0A0C2IR57_9PEZI|nr:uncharacterized protein SPBR_05422 [Sporothrix brasiliensis 5110]KIH87512.1 hypothetical protein SPBR_05422 [Sporothrix brasiliensis 5110]
MTSRVQLRVRGLHSDAIKARVARGLGVGRALPLYCAEHVQSIFGQATAGDAPEVVNFDGSVLVGVGLLCTFRQPSITTARDSSHSVRSSEAAAPEHL